MKNRIFVLGMAVTALGFTSCKGEKEKEAEKTIDTYTVYVDSVSNVPAEDAKANWQSIEATYELKNSQAETALSDLKEDQKAIGITVLKGAEYLSDEIETLLLDYAGAEKAASAKSMIKLMHDYHFGGYAKINAELIEFMNEFYTQHGIKTDAVYSGKSLYALYQLIKNDYFEKGDSIIYYHCGGLQGNKGIEDRYSINLFA